MGEGLAISSISSPMFHFPFFLNATQTCPPYVPVFLFPVPTEACADHAVVGGREDLGQVHQDHSQLCYLV